MSTVASTRWASAVIAAPVTVTEVRVLEGPNLYFPHPRIRDIPKCSDSLDAVCRRRHDRQSTRPEGGLSGGLGELLIKRLRGIHLTGVVYGA